MSSRCFAFRRTITIGAVWMLAMAALVLTSGAPASGQEGGVEPGRGSAYAQGYRIDPRNGRLSFGITYGMSLAGHQNTVAVGEARSVDLGVIGTTLAGKGCDGGDPTFPKEDQPQPLVVRSTDENSAEGKQETEYAVDKKARADSVPFAEAVATTAATGDAAVARIGSTKSTTRSGIIDGVRVATAETVVDEVTFAAGQIVLKGLRWNARWQSAPNEQATGSFTIDGIEIAGQSVPIEGGDGVDALAEANPLLEPFGIFIEPPTVRQESGISFVDPLRIGVEPSSTRDGLVGPLLGQAQPVRDVLVEALVGIDCSNASYITVADVALGGLTGAGSLNIELGGVTAQSAELGLTSFLGGLPSLAPPAPATPAPPAPAPVPTAGGGTASTPDSGSAVATTPPDDTGDDDGQETALPVANIVDGSRGGPLVWIGLGGLLLLAGLAELDRRRMRQAQRTVPLEVSR